MYDNEPERIYEAACRLVHQGISVIPTGGGISRKAKEPHVVALKASGHTRIDQEGQLRSSWKSMQQQLPSADDLRTWFLQIRARGLGMVTGAISGFVVIDVDLAGLPLMRELGWTPHVYSPSGGAHLYLKHPGWFVQSNASRNKKTLPPGFDVRGDGGYIMFPPSRNRQGQYQRTGERRPLPVQDVPEKVTVAGETYHLREALGLSEPEGEQGIPIPYRPFEGSDDDRCPMSVMLDRAADYAPESRNRGAFMLGLWANANGYRLDETLMAAEEYVWMVQGVKSSPFTVEEARSAVRSAYSYPRKEPWIKREAR